MILGQASLCRHLAEKNLGSLSEISQTEKDKYSVISLICGILKMDFFKLVNITKETGSQIQITNW